MNDAGEQLLTEIEAAGARLDLAAGEPRLRGAKLPEALLTRVKAARADVIAAAQARAERERDRWGKAPPSDWPVGTLPDMTEGQRDAVLGYVWRQFKAQSAALGEPLRRWMVQRRDDEALSALEVVMWQRDLPAAAALRWVEAMSGKAEDKR